MDKTENKIEIGEMILLGTTKHVGADIHPALDDAEFEGASVNTGACNPVYFSNFVAGAETLHRKGKHEEVEVVAYQYPRVGWCWMLLPQRMAVVLRMIARSPGITNHEIYKTTKIDSRSRVSELRAGGIIIASRQMPGKDVCHYYLLGSCNFDLRIIRSHGARHVVDAFPSLEYLDLEREKQIRAKTVKLMRNAQHSIRRLRTHAWETALPGTLDPGGAA